MGLAKPAWPALQRGHPLAQRLSRAWLFFEGAGNRSRDFAGYASDATAVGGPPWTGGPSGSTISLDGTSQYFDTSVAPGFTASTPFSIVAGVYSTADNFGGVCQTAIEAAPFDGIWFLFGGSATKNKPALIINGTSSGSIGIQASTALSNNTWYQIGLTYDGSSSANGMAYYLNGASTASGIISNSAPSSFPDRTWRIGADRAATPADFFPGYIDYVLVFSGALSAAEIAGLYSDPYAAFRPRSRWWEVLTSVAAAPNWGYENEPAFPMRRRAQRMLLQDDAVWPGTVVASPTQFGWDNPEQYPRRRKPPPLSRQSDDAFPILAVLTPTQQGFAWEPQLPIRRKPRLFRDADDQYPRTVTATPTQFGWNVEPQFAKRPKRKFNIAPSDEEWPRTAALTPGPLAWDSPIYRAIRRKFAPSVGDPDLIIATVNAAGQIVVRINGPSWKRRRSRPPQ